MNSSKIARTQSLDQRLERQNWQLLPPARLAAKHSRPALNSTSSRIVSGSRAVLLGLLALLLLAADVPAQVTNHPVDWVGGDVFAANGNGSYQVWHSANPSAPNPSYGSQPEQIIMDGLGGVTGGCGFDLAYRFFGTNVANTQVDRYSIANAHPLVQSIPGNNQGDGASSSQSVAFDAGPNLYIGYAGGATGGLGKIEQWIKNTTTGLYAFNQPFFVPVDGTAGPGWIDLAADGHTIFYTSQTRKIYKFDSNVAVSSSNPVVWADLSTLNGQNRIGTLYAIKILGPNYDGSNGVLVADKGNVKLIRASGGVITSFQVFKFNPLANLQALTLDSFDPLTTAWVGDASATTKNLLRFNISTGTTQATINTGAGVGGVCLDGGFNGAQLAFQPSTTIPKAVFPLTPTNNTLVFTSPLTGETLTATLRNLQNPVTVTIRDSLVPSSIAMSDPAVFSFNPGNPDQGSLVPGNMPCDQTLTTLAGFSNTCEVLAFEANPNSGFSSPDIIISTNQLEDTPNLRLLSNLDEDGTDGVVNYPLSAKNCVLTVNKQSVAGGFDTPTYQICSFSPADGTSFTKGANATITFKLNVAPTGQCSNSGNNNTPTGLKPLLMIEQLQTNGTAPANIPVLIAGNSGGPPIMTLSGNTYQLQVKETDMTAGFTYLATVIDLTGTIPSVSSTFILQ